MAVHSRSASTPRKLPSRTTLATAAHPLDLGEIAVAQRGSVTRRTNDATMQHSLEPQILDVGAPPVTLAGTSMRGTDRFITAKSAGDVSGEVCLASTDNS